jgi:hypothetical protein
MGLRGGLAAGLGAGAGWTGLETGARPSWAKRNEGKNLRVVRQSSRGWAESLTGPKREKENEKGKKSFYF